MLHQEFEPPKGLSGKIKCFWYDRKDFGEAETTFEVVPDGSAEIIFHFGSGCSVLQNEGFQALPSPFLIGLLDKPAVFSSKNRFEIIGIRCFPWTVFDLLGLQSGKDGVRIFEHPIASMHYALDTCINAGQITEAVALVTQYFSSERLKPSADPMLSKAGAALSKTNGTMPVGRVAEAAHATLRTLERKFKETSGRTVKDVSGLMRFEQVRNALLLNPTSNLAGLAHEFGYTDQSHLSREFKRYSGTTPAAFARKSKYPNRV
ncbi:helix-turn-helix domain-containing protein [Dyadobacter sp. CY326]|uniref:helix-turn-helix domain-containing protein n=1 Tax=Dyadobacter sp. CY326 TaxID=2907300 RepID=UPI001F32DB89|nr:helix-turn-helix domain-containing protein [Dyadobacter sp. CY326]MCE7064899.1 helix-turn-helix domain-containing protein [Dyadobacter sp. CY326]